MMIILNVIVKKETAAGQINGLFCSNDQVVIIEIESV